MSWNRDDRGRLWKTLGGERRMCSPPCNFSLQHREERIHGPATEGGSFFKNQVSFHHDRKMPELSRSRSSPSAHLTIFLRASDFEHLAFITLSRLVYKVLLPVSRLHCWVVCRSHKMPKCSTTTDSFLRASVLHSLPQSSFELYCRSLEQFLCVKFRHS